MDFDLIIRNGRLFDPAAGLDRPGGVAIRGKKIAALEVGPDATAKKVIDVRGAWITPGLIDAHTHCFWLGNHVGMPVDLAVIPNGVTAAVDAGSSGVSNFRALLRYLAQCETKTRIMLHLSAGGQIMSTQFSENIDPDVWDDSLFDQAFAEAGDRVVGLKIRASKSVLGSLGLRPIHEAVTMAERLGTRLFVHTTNPLSSMGELAGLLRPGDVMSHMYHGFGETILKNGQVDGAVRRARERGVLFDVSQGQGNFSIEVAKAAIDQGFLPDTISTDLNLENWNHPLVFSLPMCMAKHLALGMAFADVVRAVTANAAEQMGLAGELGTLREGTAADVTVFRLEELAVEFRDIHGNSLRGDRIVAPLLTVIDGQVRYRSPHTL